MSTDQTNGPTFNASSEIPNADSFVTGVYSSVTGAGESDHSTLSNPQTEATAATFDSLGEREAVEFRVQRIGAPRRRLRLTGNRYTFGSADGCTIRLNDPELRPMHAVLTREGSGVQIRAYSVPLDLNGSKVTEAPLQVGDKLRFGAYEFELLSGPTEQPTSRPLYAPSGFGQSKETRVPPRPSRSDLPPSDEVVWRDRLRREVESWRERQVDCDLRESRVDEREAALRNRETELWTRADRLYRREARLQSQEAETFQLYDEFAQKQHELLRLREQSQSRQEELYRREAEFRTQEAEYNRRLDEATLQLEQSQEQAESATQAVQRMREQFDVLNAQIEQLSSSQIDAGDSDHELREEIERLERELVDAREELFQARTDGTERQAAAEARLAEMTAQIESVKASNIAELEGKESKLAESEIVVEQLRAQVAELQSSIAAAGEESSQLRATYEEACESVRNLELLVEQHQGENEDRDRWIAKADELRATVENLSEQLADANNELTELRQANESLTAQLNETTTERDTAVADLESRPTPEAFEALRDELDAAQIQLTEMQRQFDAVDATDESAISFANGAGGLTATGLVVDGLVDPDESSDVDTAEEAADVSQPSDEGQDDEAWPTYHVTSDELPQADVEAPAEADASVWNPSAEESAGDVLPSPESSESECVAEGLAESDSTDLHASSIWNQHRESITEEASSPSPESESDSGWNGTESADEELKSDLSSVWNQHSNSDSDAVADNATDNAGLVDSSDQAETSEDRPHEPTLVWGESGEDATTDEASAAWNTPAEESGSPWQNEDVGSESAAWQPAEEVDAETDADPPMDDVWVGPPADESSEQVPDNGEDPDSSSETPGIESSLLWKDTSESADQQAPDSLSESDSVVEGSLASMLLKDIREEENNSENVADGTLLLTEVPTSPNWEHQPEETDSESSNPWGHRAEPDHSWSETPESESLDPVSDTAFKDEPSTDESESQQFEDETPAPQVPSDTSSDDNSDDSIEAYMNRLLNRVQGDTDSIAAEPVTVAASVSKSGLLAESAFTGADGAANSQEFDPDAPLVPRSQAPERQSNLSAMRDLANASARNAISRSVRVQMRDQQIQGSMRFLYALVTLGCGGAVFYVLGGTKLEGLPQYGGMLAALLFAAYFVYEGAQLFGEAKRQLKAAESGQLDNGSE